MKRELLESSFLSSRWLKTAYTTLSPTGSTSLRTLRLLNTSDRLSEKTSSPSLDVEAAAETTTLPGLTVQLSPPWLGSLNCHTPHVRVGVQRSGPQEFGAHQVALGELLGGWPLEVGQVELHATHLGVGERLHLERVLEDQTAALDLTYGTLIITSMGRERRRYQCRRKRQHRSRVHRGLGRQVDDGELHLVRRCVASGKVAG